MTRRSTTTRLLRGFQRLEDRRLMAADISLENGALFVEATEAHDLVEMRFDDSGNLEIEIDSYELDPNSGEIEKVDDIFRQYDIDDIHSMRISLLGGNDQLQIFHEDPSDAFDLVDQFAEVEILGGDGNDLINNDTDVRVQALGEGGDDSIWGGASDDYLDGGDGDDNLHGRSGDDLLVGNAGSDLLQGNAGNDTLLGHNASSSQSNAANDADDLRGGSGRDILRGGGGGDYLYGNSLVNLDDTHSNYLYGDDGDDVIIGAGQRDYMYGSNGNDTLRGKGGSDIMYGGNGNDILQGESGSDYLYGNNGTDHVSGGAGNDYLDGGLDGKVDKLSGGSGADRFIRYGYSAGRYGWVTTEAEDIDDFFSRYGDVIINRYGALTPVLR